MAQDVRDEAGDAPEGTSTRLGDSSRRALLEAAGGFLLAASGLLLPIGREVEAVDPVGHVRRRADKRRQRRQRQQRRTQRRHDDGGTSAIFAKGVSMWLYNNLDFQLPAQLGIMAAPPVFCTNPADFTVPPHGGLARYDTQDLAGYVSVGATYGYPATPAYMINVANHLFDKPSVRVTEVGNVPARCNSVTGNELLSRYFDVHQIADFRDAHVRFKITRHPDRGDFKLFTIEMFA